MSVSMIQATFQFGEVSPLLHARVDSPIYYRSVKRLRNMLVIPQGGTERRFGTEYVDQLNDHNLIPGYYTNYREVKPFLFDYEDGSLYLLVFRDLGIDVYEDNVYQSTVTTLYTSSEIESLSIAQSANIVFIAHGNHAPRTLIRASTGPVVLTLTTPTYAPFPTFDFKQNYDTALFSVYKGGVPLVTADNLLGQAVELRCNTAIFTDNNYIGGLFFADGGTLRFTGRTSTQIMTAKILKTFDDKSALFYGINAISGEECIVTERAFSNSRGWPQRVSFFQNRIFFARTSSLLGGLWGSNYNGYKFDQLNFDDSEALDTNAISTVVQGTKSTLIENLVTFKTLLVFTTSGLYSTPLLIDLPLTPTNISFLNLQTSDNANSVPPLVFDNDVVFFDKGGRKVKSVNVYATTQHYESKVISVLAPHLVDSPYSAAVFENSSVKDGSWLMQVNNRGLRDGEMSVYQSVPEQEISAWSLMTAAETLAGTSYFRHVVSDEETVYFIIERTVDGNTRLYLEQLSFDAFMDCSRVGTQVLSNQITNLDFLEGEEVVVRGMLDGSDGQAVVATTGPVTGGVVTLTDAVTDFEVGLFWSPEIVPLALNIPMPNGNNLYMPKSIKKIFVDFYETLGLRVNGELIPPFDLNGGDTYNNPAIPKTDFVQVESMTGWNPSAELSFTQDEPLPLTLLGIGFVVAV